MLNYPVDFCHIEPSKVENGYIVECFQGHNIVAEFHCETMAQAKVIERRVKTEGTLSPHLDKFDGGNVI